MTTVIVAIALVAFVPLWLLTTSLIALLGGWHALADRYAEPDGFDVEPEQRFRFRSVSLRRPPWFPASYRGCVTVSLTSAGCHLAVLAVFRFRHPPLLIPWSAITRCEEGTFLRFGWTEVESRDAEPVIRIFGRPGAAVAAEWRRQGQARDARP